MSSDAMTYALEHGNSEKEFKGFKERIFEEWEASTIDCESKMPWKSKSFCRISDNVCEFEHCFLRRCQKIK